MVQLEEIYLANIILFFNDIKSIETFSNINKKCFDVLNMVHKSPSFKYDKNKIKRKWQVNHIGVKQFKLFPQLQTFVVEKEFDQFDFIPSSVEYLEFKERDMPLPKHVLNQLKNRIRQYSFIDEQIPSSLKEYPSLKRLVLRPIGWLSLSQLFIDKSHRIELLEYSSYRGDIDINFLKEIDDYNIEKVVIDISTSYRLYNVVSQLKLSSKIQLISSFCNSTNDGSVICISQPLKISVQPTSLINESIMKNYYPNSIRFTSSNCPIYLDLSKYSFIEELDATLLSKYTFKYPSHLTALTVVQYNAIQCKLPSLRKLSCCEFIPSEFITNLTFLETITLPHFPILLNLKELGISGGLNDQEILSTVTSLTYMNTIEFDSQYLVSLKYLKTISQKLPPLNIEVLDIDCSFSPVDLRNQNYLTNLVISNLKQQPSLPNTLKSLILMNINCSETIHLDKYTSITSLIISGSSSLFIVPSSLKELYINDYCGSIVNCHELRLNSFSINGYVSQVLVDKLNKQTNC
ncbi:hypothetical protein ENUP19_0158G0020 [Entamoeba nuttalli]|uniref:Leucine-rich repeat containing protein n=2 Tax=Entamoeba nuttalli TaxID=412467 RepID=K2HMH4_ENTNP|nr:hypothetical protein ENU1_212400 [Entamoeba nuttalli P19]EKE37015.1 hypothetical protein ENU1_212400 [Entamoeba nuttalli P19]|eukprot:XP_008860651.1 hypothetical protein ENU1_212400 [Entamoeba nuttalli P19]